MEPEGPARAKAGPQSGCQAGEGRCRQERVCRDGDWVQGFGGQTCGHGRGGRSAEEGLPWGDPGLQGGVQGAGPRVPSANRASTNLTHRGICPGDPWAAIKPQGDLWKSRPQCGTLLGSRVITGVIGEGKTESPGGGWAHRDCAECPCRKKDTGTQTHGEMEARGRRGLPEAGRGRKGHPWSLCAKPGLANTLISYFWPQNFETIAFCSFKSPVLWCFVGGGPRRLPYPLPPSVSCIQEVLQPSEGSSR